jgi:hypothetical protein
MSRQIGKYFSNFTSHPYDYKHNVIQNGKAFNTSTQSDTLFAIHTKYISGNDFCQIIFFISDDTFEVLGQLRHWKVYWTQGNLTI